MSKKITAVVVGRNDDYSGDLDSRAVPSLLSMLEEFDELIYVDFNSDGESYFEKIRDKVNPEKTAGKFKHIVVKESDFQQMGIQMSGFNEAWARNIGVRRASHDYIVSTNMDVICERPSDESFDDKTMYTAARRDVPIEIYKQIPQEVLKDVLYQNTERFPAKPAVLDSEGNPIWDENDLWSVVVCCGDFQLAHKDVWENIRAFEEKNSAGEPTERGYFDTNLMKKSALCGHGIEKIDMKIFHLNHNSPTYVHEDATRKRNSQKEYVQDFKETSNLESWGFKGHDFSEEVV